MTAAAAGWEVICSWYGCIQFDTLGQMAASKRYLLRAHADKRNIYGTPCTLGVAVPFLTAKDTKQQITSRMLLPGTQVAGGLRHCVAAPWL